MPFQLKAKYGLLTYAQCGDLDAWAVNNHLGELGAECIIGREDHSDGGVHLHAFFMFEREFRSRNERVFDVDGCHPNIVRGYGTPAAGYDYAIKDGDVLAGGLERPSRGGVSPTSTHWDDIVLAETREDFFDLVRRMDSRALCTSFPSLTKYADWRYRVDPAPYVSPIDIDFDTRSIPRAEEWVRDNLVAKPIEGMLSLRSGAVRIFPFPPGVILYLPTGLFQRRGTHVLKHVTRRGCPTFRPVNTANDV